MYSKANGSVPVMPSLETLQLSDDHALLHEMRVTNAHQARLQQSTQDPLL